MVARLLHGARALEHHLIAKRAPDLHCQRLLVEFVRLIEIGWWRLQVIGHGLGCQCIGKPDDHSRHILLAGLSK